MNLCCHGGSGGVVAGSAVGGGTHRPLAGCLVHGGTVEVGHAVVEGVGKACRRGQVDGVTGGVVVDEGLVDNGT